ncbi:FK506-binding protein 2 [Hydra vulgaris]|uniref:FK506-binding protein 2 n=1 Tax=Hydra vulgaris TaxID=6087 RepID=UPI00019257B8|nr:FK506-binding protein 2-like [Hydra vulgaris]
MYSKEFCEMINAFIFFALVIKNHASEMFGGVGIGLISRPAVCERTTKDGDLLRLRFNGTLGDGTPFDTKYMEKPFEFILGEDQMISGWEAGLRDMCKGEIRSLTIPPKYAYGNNGLGNLPSRVNLHFIVELLSFHAVPNAPRVENTFKLIDKNRDDVLTHDEVFEYLQLSGIRDEPGPSGLRHMLREIFEEEDRDKNGYISQQEFSGRKRDEL